MKGHCDGWRLVEVALRLVPQQIFRVKRLPRHSVCKAAGTCLRGIVSMNRTVRNIPRTSVSLKVTSPRLSQSERPISKGACISYRSFRSKLDPTTFGDSGPSSKNGERNSLTIEATMPTTAVKVADIHTIFRAKLSLPRVTTVSSTRATPSTKAASSVILTIFTSIIIV